MCIKSLSATVFFVSCTGHRDQSSLDQHISFTSISYSAADVVLLSRSLISPIFHAMSRLLHTQAGFRALQVLASFPLIFMLGWLRSMGWTRNGPAGSETYGNGVFAFASMAIVHVPSLHFADASIVITKLFIFALASATLVYTVRSHYTLHSRVFHIVRLLADLCAAGMLIGVDVLMIVTPLQYVSLYQIKGHPTSEYPTFRGVIDAVDIMDIALL